MVKKQKGIGLIKPTLALTGGAIILGAGSQVVGSIGGPTAAASQSGLTTFASFAPVIATGIGSFIVVRQLQGLQGQIEQQTRRKRRLI